jgi:SAM-dependent methyltransferase
VTGRALVVRGDALKLPLPDACVDLVICSPPYFALRAYNAGPGEIGSEATPALFLEALWAATREMVRVLKPSGSIFVNLGDKYGGDQPAKAPRIQKPWQRPHDQVKRPQTPASRMGWPKSLLGLPWAYALGATGMLAALGGPDPALNLILRAEICWSKPNGLPESVTDRVRRSHESWFHFVRQPRYYSAIDEVREPQQYPNHGQLGKHADGRYRAHEDDAVMGKRALARDVRMLHPLGKLPGSVWSIPSEPLRLPDWLGVQHYAAFPSEWPRQLILGWSPPGICLECDTGRVPVVDREIDYHRGQGRSGFAKDLREPLGRQNGTGMAGKQEFRYQATILGYACAWTPYTDHPERRGASWNNHGAEDALKGSFPNHREERLPVREYHLDGWRPPPTRPALVLDPFGGTGTVAMVARALGRHAVSVDLSHAYSRAARWRVTSDNAAKAIARTNRERQGSLL